MGQLLYSTANTTHAEIAQLATPPAMGRFHHPYSFDSYISDIKQGLEVNDLIVNDEEFEISPNGQQLFGALEVSVKTGQLITGEEWKLLVGLRGSHDQSIPRGLTLGSQVMVNG